MTDSSVRGQTERNQNWPWYLENCILKESWNKEDLFVRSYEVTSMNKIEDFILCRHPSVKHVKNMEELIQELTNANSKEKKLVTLYQKRESDG